MPDFSGLRGPDTTMPGNNGRRIGGPLDPVAHSIRSEQNAAAAPSPDEVRKEHRKRLRSKGCEVCGEDDPDVLNMTPIIPHGCQHAQHSGPPMDEKVLCDEHRRPREVLSRAYMVQSVRNDGHDWLVEYECGGFLGASDKEVDDEEMRQYGIRPETPDVPVACSGRRSCGSPITNVTRVR